MLLHTKVQIKTDKKNPPDSGFFIGVSPQTKNTFMGTNRCFGIISREARVQIHGALQGEAGPGSIPEGIN